MVGVLDDKHTVDTKLIELFGKKADNIKARLGLGATTGKRSIVGELVVFGEIAEGEAIRKYQGVIGCLRDVVAIAFVELSELLFVGSCMFGIGGS